MVTPLSMGPSETLFTLISALVIIPVVFGFVFRAPHLVALGFIAVLFLFSDSTWGELQTTSNIYSRGAGMFYFSLLNMLLMVIGAALLVRYLARPAGMPDAQVRTPMFKYLAAFVFLLLSHIVIGLIMGVELEMILGSRGIINVLNMMVFMYLIIAAFQNEKDTNRLLFCIIALAAIRGVFGIVRFVWFDGDSANPYRNFEGMDIKIAFFDIGDNFVASLAAFSAAWLLTSSEVRLSLFKRLLLVAFLVLEIAAVALSFRRSSLIGLALMFLLLLFKLPLRRQIVFALAGFLILSVVAVIFFEHRLQFTGTQGNVVSSLIYDISPDRGGIRENRFYELYAAAQSLGSNWLFGLGTWGTFSGDPTRLTYHFGAYDFVHSGFGHIVLKTGLVGVLLFCGLLLAYASYYFRHSKYLSGTPRLLADAGFAGFLFWVPTLLIGTPIIEFRTMLLIGLSLALPFVAVGLHNYRARTYYAAA